MTINLLEGIHLERLSDIIPRQILDRRQNDQPVRASAPGTGWSEDPVSFAIFKPDLALEPAAAVVNYTDNTQCKRVIHWF